MHQTLTVADGFVAGHRSCRQPGWSSEHHAGKGEVPRTKHAISAPATQKGTSAVPAQAVLTDFNRRSAHHQVLDRREHPL
jgi:hypothetical protein